jgi:hypothetical protein
VDNIDSPFNCDEHYFRGYTSDIVLLQKPWTLKGRKRNLTLFKTGQAHPLAAWASIVRN